MVTATRSPRRCAPFCESSGRRSCESMTMRSSGRPRGRPVRSVSRQIVGQHRADAGKDRVVIVAQFLHVGAGALAGDPAAIVVGRGDLAVQRDGGLQRHQRPPGAHEVQKRLVQLGGFGGEFRRHLDFDTGGAQLAKAFAGHQRIGIFHAAPPRAPHRPRSARRRRAACGRGASRAPG